MRDIHETEKEVWQECFNKLDGIVDYCADDIVTMHRSGLSELRDVMSEMMEYIETQDLERNEESDIF